MANFEDDDDSGFSGQLSALIQGGMGSGGNNDRFMQERVKQTVKGLKPNLSPGSYARPMISGAENNARRSAYLKKGSLKKAAQR